MKSNVISKNQNQNYSTFTNNGMNIFFTIDQTPQKTLSIKSLFKSNLSGAALIENLKIKIVLSENVSVDIVDDLLDFDIARSNIEFILNKNSLLNYDLKITELQEIDQTDDGLLVAYNKQGYFEKELIFRFIGSKSQAKANCIVKGTNDRLFKIKTIQDHQVGHTKSDLVIKGAFCQKSKLFCNSLIKVSKNAQKVEVSQLNKNLLLGCNSEAISVPKLEVEADDVACKHGAVISKLDDEHIFYLQSRGINYCNAKNLLIDGFLN